MNPQTLMMVTKKDLLMKISKFLYFLDGFALTNYNMVIVTKVTLLESMEKYTTIVSAVITINGIGLPDVKNGAATNTNAVRCLKVMQLATSHPVNTAWTPSKTTI